MILVPTVRGAAVVVVEVVAVVGVRSTETAAAELARTLVVAGTANSTNAKCTSIDAAAI